MVKIEKLILFTFSCTIFYIKFVILFYFFDDVIIILYKLHSFILIINLWSSFQWFFLKQILSYILDSYF